MRVPRPAPAEIGAGLLAAGLLATGLAWSGWSVARLEADTQRAAAAMLERVTAREQVARAAHGRFLPFGPMTAEQRSLVPGPEARDAALFDVDGLVDERGVMHLQLRSRPEAVRAGQIAPLVRQVQLSARP